MMISKFLVVQKETKKYKIILLKPLVALHNKKWLKCCHKLAHHL